MLKNPFTFMSYIVVCCLPCQGQEDLRKPQDPREVQIILQQQSAFVKHNLTDAGSRIALTYSTDELDASHALRIVVRSVEKGRWSTPSLFLGKCFVSKKETGADSRTFIIRPDPVIAIDAATRRYRAELVDLQKDAVGNLDVRLASRVATLLTDLESVLRVLDSPKISKVVQLIKNPK